MDYKDYYSTLGVTKQASADEIQKAYRKLARKYHPDVNRGTGAEDKFKEITESYEVLKDPEKRKTYDRFGKDWKSYSGGRGAPPPGFQNVRFDFGGGGGSGFSSFFDALFGGAGGGSPFGGGGARGGGSPFGGATSGNPFAGGDPLGRGGFRSGAGFTSRGQDQEARIVLTLEEAAGGGTREISLTDPTTGGVKTYTINLPRGVKAGQKIRLAGRGGQGAAGGKAGDLLLKVEIKADDRFRLEGIDLYTDLTVSPWEAALGVEVTVKTLDGSVKVHLPPGSSTGRKIRLRGRGFPRRGTSETSSRRGTSETSSRRGTSETSSQRGTSETSPNPKGAAGDLYAEVKVVVPDRLTRKERKLFEQLAEVSSFKPR